VQEFGKPEGGFSQMEYQDGEQIKSLSLWGNGAGTRLGAIRIRTTLSQEFFPKMTKWNLKKEYPIDVGSGICLGVLGKGGDDIDILQDTAEDGRPGASVLRVIAVSRAALGFSDHALIHLIPAYRQKLKLSKPTVRASKMWTSEAVEELRTCLDTTDWDVFRAATDSLDDYTDTVTSFCFVRIASSQQKPGLLITTINPDSLGFVFINIGRATVDLPYMAKVKITCYNGKTLKFNTSWIYKCVTYTNAKTIVTEKCIRTISYSC
uniref:Jacalin-type lectin domain-containing protein n=1 Tax=Oryzias latipes TaxID=8090 RepID=A0A3P9JCM3_ORYLA